MVSKYGAAALRVSVPVSTDLTKIAIDLPMSQEWARWDALGIAADSDCVMASVTSRDTSPL